MDKMLADVPGATQIEKLAHLYFTTQSGMMALPLNIPGSKFWKAMNVSCPEHRNFFLSKAHVSKLMN
jgi:hypothetical protein